MRMSTRTLTTCFIASATLLGCERAVMTGQDMHNDQPEPSVSGELASLVPPGTNTSVAEAIAKARCEHEQRCGEVGSGQKYASPESCVAAIRAQWRDDLSVFQCSEGIDQNQLRSCIDEIREESCGSPLDSLSRYVACNFGTICEN